MNSTDDETYTGDQDYLFSFLTSLIKTWLSLCESSEYFRAARCAGYIVWIKCWFQEILIPHWKKHLLLWNLLTFYYIGQFLLTIFKAQQIAGVTSSVAVQIFTSSVGLGLLATLVLSSSVVTPFLLIYKMICSNSTMIRDYFFLTIFFLAIQMFIWSFVCIWKFFDLGTNVKDEL